MTIEVTQNHIDNGIRGSVTDCAFGLAWREANGSGENVWAGFTKLSLTALKQIDTPTVVKEFMSNYDNGRKVEPFSVEIN